MLVYLGAFSLSFLFGHLARKSKNTRDNAALWVFSFLSILCIVLIAGLRDYSIGIDVKNYLRFPTYWRGAYGSDSVMQYLRRYLADGNTELLFALMLGIIAKTTGEYRVFLFAVHTIIITCIYIGAYRQRKYIRYEFVLLFFCLLFFSHSLNIMRQYLALSIGFAFFADLEQKKYIRYTIVVAISVLFHTSAVAMFLPIPFYVLLYGWSGTTNKHLTQFAKFEKNSNIITRFTMKDAAFRKKMFLCAAIVVGEVFLTTIFSSLISIGLLNEKYTYYLNSNDNTPALLVSGFLLIEMFGILILWKDMKRTYPHAFFWVVCTITDFVFQQLSTQMAYAKRIALGFSLLNTLTLSLMVSACPQKDKRVLVSIAVTASCLLYWGYIYIYRNASQTFPYRFGIF